jgi:hypothetical protein
MSFDNQFDDDDVFSTSEESQSTESDIFESESPKETAETSQQEVKSNASFHYEQRQKRKEEKRQLAERQAEREELQRLKQEVEALKSQATQPKQDEDLEAYLEELDQSIIDSPAKGVAQIVKMMMESQQTTPSTETPEASFDGDVFESVVLPYYQEVAESEDFKGFSQAEESLAQLIDSSDVPAELKNKALFVVNAFETLEDKAETYTRKIMQQYNAIASKAMTPKQRQNIDNQFNEKMTTIATKLIEAKLNVFDSPKGQALIADVQKLIPSDIPQNTRQQLEVESKSQQRVQPKTNPFIPKGFDF